MQTGRLRNLKRLADAERHRQRLRPGAADDGQLNRGSRFILDDQPLEVVLHQRIEHTDHGGHRADDGKDAAPPPERLVDQIDTQLAKAADLGFVRPVKQSDSFEVRRILKAFVDAQWLARYFRPTGGR